MKKKESCTGMYETTFTSDISAGKLFTPTKMSLTDKEKEAVSEYLKESDEFYKLVCAIIENERDEVAESPELEKIKEDYSNLCSRYKQEREVKSELPHRVLKAERERDFAVKLHKNLIDEISSMLKEVDCYSVRDIVDALKAERANGKRLAEDNQLCRRNNDRLKQSYNNVCEEIYELRRELEKVKKERDSIQLNGCNKNQAKTITDKIKEIELLEKGYQYQSDLAQKYREKPEKLQSKLDKASKRYDELIKIISVRAIKSI